jgi:uncharacterized protein
VQSVEAVVTAIAPGLGGLHIQEEPVDADADLATSAGLFVYLGEAPDPSLAVGDLVRVKGTVTEYVTSGGASSQTELAGSPIVTACGPGAAIPPAAVVFPLLDPAELEAVEGMLVTLPQDLVISEYYNFDRYGEVVVSLPPEGWDRLYTPTAVVEPGQDAIDLAADYATRRITIDDARSAQNPDPAIHPGNGLEFTLDNHFRGGDTIAGIAGVIDHTFGLYRLQPTAYGTYGVVSPRPESPDPVGGNVRVATMNVLNYFLTLDDKNRPVLAQTFEDLASGERFTVAVNHLKSRGSPCDDVGDPDLSDGQGNCNLTRTAAAEALVDWLSSDPTGSGDGRYLIIGDLNTGTCGSWQK